MSLAEQARADYDALAAQYGDYSALPTGRLESQLVQIALGDCTGLHILDLAGGSGVHARAAVALGAARVDVVDISPGMLRVGRERERALGRAGVVRFFEGDVARPLAAQRLGLLGARAYDVVLGNWVFSFAATPAAAEAVFANAAAYLKPGGRFVGARDHDPWSPALAGGRYGGSCKWLRRIPGGVRYRCVLHSTPPVEFDGACLETIYSGSPEMWERFGFVGLETVPYESAAVVREDPDFWQAFLERPHLAVVRAYMGKGA